jgi:hypothetical protein
MVVRGILTTRSTSLVVRITVATLVILGSRTMIMRAIGSNSLTKTLHPISGLVHNRFDVSFATFLVTQRSNVHS